MSHTTLGGRQLIVTAAGGDRGGEGRRGDGGICQGRGGGVALLLMMIRLRWLIYIVSLCFVLNALHSSLTVYV